MKDFFTQCMKDLFAITGIEQVKWMQNDLVNGKRDFDLCVESMVQVSAKFEYISEEDQQVIIRRMMVEDKQYKGLNSRTVWGWLDMHKDTYYRGQTHFEETEHNPAPPEVADKYMQEWKQSLEKIGNPEIVNGLKTLREERGTFVTGTDSIGYQMGKTKFVINDIEIFADSQEQAQKMYDETFS